MKEYQEELTPVEYGPSAIKIYHHSARAKQPCLTIHWHDRMELIRLQEGEITVGYESTTAVLHPGEIYIVPPRTPHYGVAGSSGAAWDVVMFDVRSFYNDTELCRSYLEPLFDGRAKLCMCTGKQEIVDCVDKLVRLVPENDFGVIPTVYQLLDLLFRYEMVELSGDVKGRHIITQATEYIKEHFAEEISTRTLAGQFGYSEEHFCRLFKQTTQFTPMRYLMLCRMEKAVNLLNDSERSISEIAALCGFSDSNYFTRCFKSFFGTVPSKMGRT